jgi:hypothetical protein
MQLDLTDEEMLALLNLLTETIETDRPDGRASWSRRKLGRHEVAARGLEALKVRLLHNSGLLRLLATELGGVI